MKRSLLAFITVIICCLAGCAGSFNSIRDKETGRMELIAGSESELLGAAHEAITREFPAANVNRITGYETGFSWFHQPFADRENFKFLLKQQTGLTKDETKVSGYSYSILASGTLFFTNARWAQPLATEFNNVLAERGIQKITVEKMVYKREQWDDATHQSKYEADAEKMPSRSAEQGNTAPGVGSKEIPLEKGGGVYKLPVKINGVISLKFILDTGASEVTIPADVALTLLRTETILQSDFLPGKSYQLADGTIVKSPRFIIRELDLGGIKITQVQASIAPVTAPLLLGQSFLGRLGSWEMDNNRHVLIIRGVK